MTEVIRAELQLEALLREREWSRHDARVVDQQVERTPPEVAHEGAHRAELGEIEPRIAISAANTPGNASNVFKITQPGSYYLTGDLNVPAGKDGIHVDAAGVTIDLCGYSIVGGITGIWGTVPDGVLTVRNGQVRRAKLYFLRNRVGKAATTLRERR